MDQQYFSQGQNKQNVKMACVWEGFSAIFLVLMQLCLKKMALHQSAFYILGVRGSILFLYGYIAIRFSGHSLSVRSSKTYHLLLKRGLVCGMTIIMYYYPIKYIPIGIANTLFNTNPIIIIFIQAFYFHNHKIQWKQLALTAVSFLGVALILKPGLADTNEAYIFYVFVLLSALTNSFSMLYMHDLRGKVNELLPLLYANAYQISIPYILFQITYSTQSTEGVSSQQGNKMLMSIVFTFMMSVFAFLTQYCTAKSTYLCKPGLSRPFSYLSVIAGMVADVMIFGTPYNWTVVLGAILTSAGLFSILIK